MSGLLPEEVRLRPQKAWFDSLIVACLTGPDAPVIRRLLSGPSAETRAYIRRQEIELALDSLHRGSRVARFRAMHLVWRALTLECWLRRQSDPRGAALPDPGELSAPALELQSVGEVTGAGKPRSYLFPS